MDNAIYKRNYTKVVKICVEMDMAYEQPEEIFLECEDL